MELATISKEMVAYPICTWYGCNFQ